MSIGGIGVARLALNEQPIADRPRLARPCVLGLCFRYDVPRDTLDWGTDHVPW
jgi:hypothetical protein